MFSSKSLSCMIILLRSTLSAFIFMLLTQRPSAALTVNEFLWIHAIRAEDFCFAASIEAFVAEREAVRTKPFFAFLAFVVDAEPLFDLH